MYTQQEQPKTSYKKLGLGIAAVAAVACVGVATIGSVQQINFGETTSMVDYKGRNYKLCPWDPIKENRRGPQAHPANRVWSKEIYETIINQPDTLKTTTGGVNHNASWGKLSKDHITKEDADWLCQNPCVWYYNKGSAKKAVSEMCKCNSDNEKTVAVNWC